MEAIKKHWQKFLFLIQIACLCVLMLRSLEIHSFFSLIEKTTLTLCFAIGIVLIIHLVSYFHKTQPGKTATLATHGLLMICVLFTFGIYRNYFQIDFETTRFIVLLLSLLVLFFLFLSGVTATKDANKK